MPDTPTVCNNPGLSCFELIAGGEVAGRVTYHYRDGAMVLDHTEVYEAHSGQGFGSVLARGIFDDVRERGATVSLSCPYLERWIARHQDYSDVVVGEGVDAAGADSPAAGTDR